MPIRRKDPVLLYLAPILQQTEAGKPPLRQPPTHQIAMKSTEEKIETPVPCSHCGGTGKVPATPPAEGEPTDTVAYENKTCPVCGGSGKAPAPTVEHSERTRKCFVATVAFGDPDCQELVILRRFRDEKLLPHRLGQRFVALYYTVGPSLAAFVGRRPTLKAATRRALAFVCRKLPRE